MSSVHQLWTLPAHVLTAARTDGPLSSGSVDRELVSRQLPSDESYWSVTPIWSIPSRPSFTARSIMMKPSTVSRSLGMVRDTRITPQ